MKLTQSATTRAASIGGAGLAAAARAIAAVRPAAKPLHPQGQLVHGELVRTGTRPWTSTGVPWLDEPGRDQVLVRQSRAVGLPRALPDIHGLALRVPLAHDRHGDLLFATTGTGRWTRFLLVPGWRVQRPMTTLLPYRTQAGPVLLALRAVSERRYELAHARGRGDWRPFGELLLSETAGSDPTISFDPVRNPLPGLDHYDWVVRLREPAYLTARRTRSGR
ncbi:MAG: hypothetical protein ACXWDL_07215 [Nocardioides sp.]